MTIEFEREKSLFEQLETGALFDDISCFLREKRAGLEMQQMDEEIADQISPEDYRDFARYKQFCMDELGPLNKIPGPNAILASALERGFILGYWFARHAALTEKS